MCHLVQCSHLNLLTNNYHLPIKRGSIPSFDLTLQCLMETPNENDDNNTAMNTPTRFPSPRRRLVTPLCKQIEENPRLRNTKRTLPTPLRNAIKAAPPLKKTKQALPTPVRRAIHQNQHFVKLKNLCPLQFVKT